MTKESLSETIFSATLVLSAADPKRFAPVIRWMKAREKKEREDAKPKRRRKVKLFDRRGHSIELFQADVKRMTE